MRNSIELFSCEQCKSKKLKGIKEREKTSKETITKHPTLYIHPLL